MKKILSLFLAVILLSGTFCFNVFAEGSYSEIKNITQNSGWYTKSGEPELVYESWTDMPNISFNWGNGDYDKQMFEFDLPEAGKYAISIRSKQSAGQYISRTALYVERDGEYKRISEISMPGTNGQFEFTQMGVIDAEAGVLKIRLDMVFADIILNAVKVELLTAPELTGVKAGNLEVEADDIIKRGTDSFEFSFSGDLKAIDDNAEISVLCGGKEIKSSAMVSGNKLNIFLNETLDYEKNCVIKISNLKDVKDVFVIDDIEFPFATDSSLNDGVLSSVSDLDVKTVYNDVTLTGRVVGTLNQGIKGRNVELFLKDTEGNMSSEAIAEVISGDDGLFEINFKLDDELVSGIYTLCVTTEYQPGPLEKEFNYVSKDLEEELLDELAKKADASLVEAFMSDNQTALMIDIENNLKGITNKEAFYDHFVGVTFENGDIFRDFFFAHLSLEKINQTSSSDVIGEIFADEKACELLNVNKEKIEFVVNNKDAFLEDVLALEAINNIDDFSDALEALINDWLKKEYEIADSDIALEDLTLKTGQEIELLLDLEDEVTAVNKLTYNFKLSGDAFAESEEVKLSINGDYSISRKGEIITVVITPVRPLKEVKEIGILSLVAAECGDYEIKASGELNYVISVDSKETDVIADINEKTIEVEITDETKDKKPNRVTTTPSGGGGGGGNSTPSVTPPPVEIPTTPPQIDIPTETPGEDKFEFKDIDGYDWAKEGIYDLLERGVISESEDKLFNPSNEIKREELVKMIVLAFGLFDENAECDFDDVAKDSWYYRYVASAYKAGIVKGIDDVNFGSGNYVTREELATMLYRIAEFDDAGDLIANFVDDAEISEWAKDAVYQMASKGIINGVAEGIFSPKTNATRAMAAKLISSITEEVQ